MHNEGLTAIGLAVFGGTAKLGHEWSTGRPVTWRLVTGRLLVSAYVEFLFYEICNQFGSGWTHVVCLLAGWAGTESIVLAHRLLRRHFGMRSADEKPQMDTDEHR